MSISFHPAAFAGPSSLSADAPSSADDHAADDAPTADASRPAFAFLLSAALVPPPAPAAPPADAGAEVETADGEQPDGTPDGETLAGSASAQHGAGETSAADARPSYGSARYDGAHAGASFNESRASDAAALFASAHARHSALLRGHADGADAGAIGATPAADAATTAASDAVPTNDNTARAGRGGWRAQAIAAAPTSPEAATPDSDETTDAASPSDASHEPHAGAAPPDDMNAALLGVLLAASAPAAGSASAAVTPALATPSTGAAADATAARRAARTAATRTDNDLSSLDPEFRGRLERVITRMTGEMGHTVEVLETYRDQGRQEELYAQGRSAPGPVVTWTRNSLHTLGRAADLRVDGGVTDGPGYRDLRRLAEAEGLHTLGAKDPGHVELPRTGGEQRLAWSAPARAEPAASVPGSIMTKIVVTGAGDQDAPAAPTVFAKQRTSIRDVAPDEVPEVAAVARVATVATVARVATPGAPGVASAAAAAEPARRHVPNEAERRRAARGVAVASADPSAMSAGDARPAVAPASSDERAATLSAVRADAAARVGRIMDLQDKSAPTTVSQMLLTVDDGAGGGDRVRVDVRGRSVSAALAVGDAAQADRLAQHAGELRDALTRQGLEAGPVTVTSRAAEVDATRAAVVSAGAARHTDASAGARQQGEQQQQQQNQQGTKQQYTSERGRAGRDAEPDPRDGSRGGRRESSDPRHRPSQGQKENDAQ